MATGNEKQQKSHKAFDDLKTPAVVSRQEWETARGKLLEKEKEAMRAQDALAAERRRLPWMAVEKNYHFEGPNGPVTLLDLFEGLTYHAAHIAFVVLVGAVDVEKLQPRDAWQKSGPFGIAIEQMF